MMSTGKQKEEFVFIPERKDNVPGMRFARRRNTIRPIKFLKTWDKTFSPKGSEPLVPDVSTLSPKFLSQPNPVKHTDDHQEKDNHRVSPTEEPEDQAIATSILSKDSVDNSLTSKVRGKTLVSRQSTPTQQKNQRKSSQDDSTTAHVATKSSALNQSKTHSISKYMSRSDQILNLSRGLLSSKRPNQDQNQENKPVENNNQNTSIQNEKTLNNDINAAEGDSNAVIDEQPISTNQQNELLPNNEEEINENESPQNEEEESHTKVSSQDHEQENQENRSAQNNQGENLHNESSQQGDDENHEHSLSIDAENINITHKIPLAQSTAIGVEIEQELEDDEEQSQDDENMDNVNNENEATTGQTIHDQQPGSVLEKTETRKRKVTTDTPTGHTTTGIKKRKITITTPVSVENVDANGSRSVATRTSPRKKKNPAELSDNVGEEVPQMSKGKSTPKSNLRKTSPKKTPITANLAIPTPKSGPSVRVPKPANTRRVQILDVSSESSSGSVVEEVRLWQDNVGQRKLSDVSDLDVILQTFEQMAWDFKESIESGCVRKAVMLFAKKTQSSLRNLVTLTQKVKHLKNSQTKNKSTLRKRREELVTTQKDHISAKVELAELKMEHNSTVSRSEKQSDILSFQQVIRNARKQADESKQGSSRKDRLIVPSADHHKSLPTEILKQLPPVQQTIMNTLSELP